MKIAHISDLHIGKDSDPRPLDRFDAFLGLIVQQAPDVLVVSGDLVHVPEDTDAFQTVRERLDLSGLRWLAICGNHDIHRPENASQFDDFFGTTPRVERIDDVDFLLFDSFRDLPTSDRSKEEQSANHMANGRVSQSQYQLMERQLSAPTRVAVVHHHVVPEAGAWVAGEWVDEEASGVMMALWEHKSFLSWCSANDVSLILHGHKHAPADPIEHDGMLILRGSAAYKEEGMARIIDVRGPTVLEVLTF